MPVSSSVSLSQISNLRPHHTPPSLTIASTMISTTTLSLAAATIILAYIVKCGIAYRKAVNGIDNLPGHRTPLAPYSILGMIVQRIPGLCAVGITTGTNFVYEWGYDIYARDKFGWDVRSLIHILPATASLIFLADAAAAKEVTSSRARFPKAVIFYDILSFFGENIVASEGEKWKKYRKIVAPAFVEKNNKVVWYETTRIMNELIEGEWKDEKEIVVDHVLDVTLPITLFVISCAGFGQNISWANDANIPAGHKMSFKHVMQVMSKDFFVPIVVPRWAAGITKRTKVAWEGFEELKNYILEMIHQRLYTEDVERHDLFSLLLEENSQHMDSASLSDDELIGNMFLFLIAGYETTSHSLAFALGLLALYQDEQEKMYQHIQTVLGGREMTYADTNNLTYVMAVFQETLRLYPPVIAIPKVSVEDTSLTLYNQQGQAKRIPVPKGTYINIHVTAIHTNPRYWKDPKKFNPSRFLDPEWPRDAFIPFSAGSRACLGRRFAEIEVIVVLTTLVSKYKITVKEEPRFAHETFEERERRVMATDTGLSLTPLRVPLVFMRRS